MFKRPVSVEFPITKVFGESGDYEHHIDPDTGFWLPGKNPLTKQGNHPGTDFDCPDGTMVTAVGGGWITRAGWDDHMDHSRGLGMRVVQLIVGVGFDSWQVTYGHLSAIYTWPGDRVFPGSRIGLSGSSGACDRPHVHVEMLNHKKQFKAIPLEG